VYCSYLSHETLKFAAYETYLESRMLWLKTEPIKRRIRVVQTRNGEKSEDADRIFNESARSFNACACKLHPPRHANNRIKTLRFESAAHRHRYRHLPNRLEILQKSTRLKPDCAQHMTLYTRCSQSIVYLHGCRKYTRVKQRRSTLMQRFTASVEKKPRYSYSSCRRTK
jgi:hypothetical protein